MNEKLKQLYQKAHEPQPPIRGKTEQTKDILWGQPDKFNPEKFAELLVRATMQEVERYAESTNNFSMYECAARVYPTFIDFGVEE